MVDRARHAYLDGLKLLARRELSETQVRQRLARKGHQQTDIDDAIAKLKDERAIDDHRVAAAIARSETGIKRRGKLRVTRAIERAGISRDTARHAVNAAFETVEPRELIEAALRKRLGSQSKIADEKQFARLYRYLAAQGFEAGEIVRVLKARSVK